MGERVVQSCLRGRGALDARRATGEDVLVTFAHNDIVFAFLEGRPRRMQPCFIIDTFERGVVGDMVGVA